MFFLVSIHLLVSEIPVQKTPKVSQTSNDPLLSYGSIIQATTTKTVLEEVKTVAEEIGGEESELTGDETATATPVVRSPKSVPEAPPSLQLVWPIECPRITQKFSRRHQATDMVADCENKKIKSAMYGTIQAAGWNGGYGQRVVVENGDVQMVYAHFSKISVKEGETVTLGQELGIQGSTGRSTGNHLHLELIFKGRKLDPLMYLTKP